MDLSDRKRKKKVAIVGARGYSGLELARILLRHPETELVACFAHDQPFSLADYLPEPAAREVKVLPLKDLGQVLPGLDCVFLATPTEASLALAPEILAAKDSAASVIDLSGAFRFQAGSAAERAATFEAWYKTKAPTAVAHSYGLVPFAKPVNGAKTFISNPGCYATAVLMGLIPLLRANALVSESIVIDAKSGSTGAGRKAAEGQLFAEVEGECLPYRVGQHQHLPEIREWAEAFGGSAIDPFFTTHLLPVRRGIIAGIYGELQPAFTAALLADIFASSYKNYPLVRITNLDAKENELSASLSLSLKRVTGTARVHLSYRVVGQKLYLFSVIDNLLKGAASQAVENFNQLHDYPVALALDGMEGTL